MTCSSPLLSLCSSIWWASNRQLRSTQPLTVLCQCHAHLCSSAAVSWAQPTILPQKDEPKPEPEMREPDEEHTWTECPLSFCYRHWIHLYGWLMKLWSVLRGEVKKTLILARTKTTGRAFWYHQHYQQQHPITLVETSTAPDCVTGQRVKSTHLLLTSSLLHTNTVYGPKSIISTSKLAIFHIILFNVLNN